MESQEYAYRKLGEWAFGEESGPCEASGPLVRRASHWRGEQAISEASGPLVR